MSRGRIESLSALRQCRGNPWVALVAAYVLFLQATLGALASGATPPMLQPDPSGHINCISGTGLGPVNQPDPAEQHRLPDCCLTGCLLFAPVALPSPDPAAALRLADRAAANPRVYEPAGRFVPRREGLPARPRGPPAEA